MATDPVQRVAGNSGHITDHNQIHGRVTGVISVKEPPFNAAGDDATDDTAAFQNAIFAQQVSGGTIWVPPGTYRISDQLVPAPAISASAVATKPLLISGAGMHTSIIKQTVSTIFGGLFSYGRSGQNPTLAQVVMSDLCLDGNYSGIDGGALAQDGVGGQGALVAFYRPYTSGTIAGAPTGVYHQFTRVRFYRPTGFGFQPANSIWLNGCLFDGCGQPAEAVHYDNIGGGGSSSTGDIIVMGCTWKDSAGNFVDLVSNTAKPARGIFIGNESYGHIAGGLYIAGAGSVVVGNSLQNTTDVGGGVGYDADGDDNSTARSGNIVALNRLTNIYVNASGLSFASYGDRVFGNIAADDGWQAWTPTITAETGTYSSVTITFARYRVQEKTVFFEVAATGTTASGVTAIFLTLPVNQTTQRRTPCSGEIENVVARATAGTSDRIEVRRYDAAALANAAGKTVYVAGAYEIG